MVYSHTVGGVHSTHSPGGAVETETGELEVVQGSDVEGAPSVEREKSVHILQDYSTTPTQCVPVHTCTLHGLVESCISD